LFASSISMPQIIRRDAKFAAAARRVPEETPVALVFHGTTLAVFMATPADLEDFAVGFSLTEGIIRDRSEIEDLTVIFSDDGIELRMWLAAGRADQLQSRRRSLVGPTGCGLCGIESLAAAVLPGRKIVDGICLGAIDIEAAVDALAEDQALNKITRATHAAGLYVPDGGLLVAREDVGRHNALDKLAGALCREGISGDAGAVVITSRVSVEMVQKTAAIGSSILIAISAPTALAIRTAEACDLTLVAVARGSSFEVFSHPRRVVGT
jgi:FdhD protein